MSKTHKDEDCSDDYSIRSRQGDVDQKSSGDEIFACKVGATQIKSVLAPCLIVIELLIRD